MHEGSGGGNFKKSNLMGDNHLNVIPDIAVFGRYL